MQPNTPDERFFDAVKNYNIDQIRALIKEGKVNINKTDKHGLTALHFVAGNGK